MEVNREVMPNVGLESEKPKPKVPTVIVDLPSKGWFYPVENPASSGKVEIRYMTAKDEDILANDSYIRQGTALDRLMQNLLVTDVNWDDLLPGDKNAIMISARITSYSSRYTLKVTTPSGNEQTETIDLSSLKYKTIDESLITEKNKNRFKFKLPFSEREITFKLLTGRDEREIESLIKGYEKAGDEIGLLTLRLKFMIIGIDGKDDVSAARSFVDNELLAVDSRALRNYINKINPDVDFTVMVEDRSTREYFRTSLTSDPSLLVRLFWPDFEG